MNLEGSWAPMSDMLQLVASHQGRPSPRLEKLRDAATAPKVRHKVARGKREARRPWYRAQNLKRTSPGASHFRARPWLSYFTASRLKRNPSFSLTLLPPLLVRFA